MTASHRHHAPSARTLEASAIAMISLVFCAASCTRAATIGVEPHDGTDAGTADAGPPEVRCSRADDPRHGHHQLHDEGGGDPDRDGRPSSNDDDADGDGFLDRDEAGDGSCFTPPVDSDSDGTPDFLDTDGNGDGVDDGTQHDTDLDHDGTPDGRDLDLDGDGILNVVECAAGACPDTDGDTVADVRDLDSDGDTIGDATEGALDLDGDMIGNFRDTDSDRDGVPDAVEAGDADLATVPASCPREIDPATGVVQSDGNADAFDFDSDNDGFGDGQERLYQLDPCDVDTDDDRQDDLAEGAYSRVNCPDGTTGRACDCGRNAGCRIPDSDFYMALPYGASAMTRTLEFGTTIRVADVFFVTDTTASMGGTLSNVKLTVAATGGLIDRITAIIPDAWIGGGQHDDFPFTGVGVAPDEPFILAARTTPPERRAAVRDAFSAIALHNGDDGPEAQTEALYQIITGDGGTWSRGAQRYTMPRYADLCPDSGYGAACFREAALPILIHFTDVCSHQGPPGESPSCTDYSDMNPPAHTWTDAVAALGRRGAKYVGVNVSAGACMPPYASSGISPCFFMNQTAVATHTVDVDGNPLVYNLPNNESARAMLVDTVANAVATIATRVPLDVDTAVRDDATDEEGVDATRFIKRREPACSATPPTTPCWSPPTGTSPGDAVARVDTSTFYGVVPGTRVLFTITFQNDFVLGANVAKVFVAYIDVRGGGASVLDTRQVYIVVPASPVPFG